MKKFLILAIAIVVIFGALCGFFIGIASRLALFEIFLSLTPSTPYFPKTNVLILGVDSAFGHRSDTIMVLHTDPDNKSASVISIPRDTLTVLPGRGLDKINHAYAYGGVEYSRKTVETLLNIEIPYYIVINLSGIVHLIDELGGITIDVEKRMYYVDYAGGLYVNLQPGTQKLTGEQAMGYLRYRTDGGDLTRINRQQKFLMAFSQELTKSENRLKSPALFMNLLSNLDTNLSSRDTLGMCLGLRAAHEVGKVYMATTPGSDSMIDGIYYLQPDMPRLQEIVNKYLLDGGIESPTSEGSTLNAQIQQN